MINRLSDWMVWALAAVAFLAPLKLGTPVVLQGTTAPPGVAADWLFFSWPNQVGVMVGALLLVVALVDRKRLAAQLDALLIVPLLFLASQLAVLHSICPQTSADTVVHFAVCVVWFCLAAWYVRDGAAAVRLFGGLGLAAVLVCIFAMQQWLGALEETRRFAAQQFGPGKVSPDLLLRLSSNRVFGTLVSPNTLAGYLALAFVPALAWIWTYGRKWHQWLKWAVLALVGGLILFCLVLTGSRGGLVAFVAAVAAAVWCGLEGRPRARVRAGLAAGVVLAGVLLGAYRGGLVRVGFSSLEARMDYWTGAAAIARDHLWTGTGPGTFGSIYPQYKTAVTEEARLVHNNYLEMWSDSGVVAFVLFAALWVAAVVEAFRLARQRSGDPAALAIAAGLVAWTVHGLVDSDMYTPGVAYPAFLLLGALQGLKPFPNFAETGMARRVRWWAVAGGVVLLGAVAGSQGRQLAASLKFGPAQPLQLEPVEPAQALAAARGAVALAPNNGYYQAVAGDWAAQVGRAEDAIDFYRRAIQCDPHHASYHWRLGQAEAAVAGASPAAIEQLRLAVELNPTNPRYWNDLARLLGRFGEKR